MENYEWLKKHLLMYWFLVIFAKAKSRLRSEKGDAMRYWKVLAWTALSVMLLTAGQFGCVHLLTRRPASWLFEASLDFGPPLLFFGDIVQSMYTGGSQAPLRDQPVALATGMIANICLYGAIAVIVAWLFFPPARSSRAQRPNSAQ